MSNRLCNYCEFEKLKRLASQNSLVITKHYRDNKLGGVDVYVHPRGIDINKIEENKKEDYFVAWYMELPNKCAC